MEQKRKLKYKYNHTEVKPVIEEKPKVTPEDYVEKRLKEIYEFTDKREKTW